MTQGRMSIAEFKAQIAKINQSKYRNKRTKIDGISFDSKAEASRYCELKTLRAAGEVQWFIRQPRFLLHEGFEKDGEAYKPIYYVADFLICWADGSVTVEDVKGMKTRTYLDKRKLFERRYPTLKIVEVQT